MFIKSEIQDIAQIWKKQIGNTKVQTMLPILNMIAAEWQLKIFKDDKAINNILYNSVQNN